ncbi:plasmid stabilization system [Methanolacinia petrolearia DSM 11571]|uniref:Plasmid stabilization system n=1 Tax=Methanolacinia petrolearia (strain DSM 11571 / OCM 486 / SEBR 4847) TaxID=679926 RepID=E1RGN2_METP4|nr:type II toxin-antitoxin system RelE/ParE family toxin [Methanolacinia petrolearia]ADN36327.1 plasmid stabilization system [Methanolacinia petrolearia DSM 11571]
MNNIFSLVYGTDFKLKLKKICRNDKRFCNQIENKIVLIQENPKSGKAMKSVLKGTRRIHAGHYAIFYGIDYETRKIILMNIGHYDRLYTKK